MANLILKLPKDKPPYIGVRLDTLNLDIKNISFFRDIKGKEVKIVLEVFMHSVTVKLICEELVKVHSYTVVQYDAERLKNWLYIRGDRAMNFGLTYYQNDQEHILTYWNAGIIKAVCPVNELKVVEPPEPDRGYH